MQLLFSQIAFAEHQNNMAKMYGADEKCSGMKKIDWSDSLRGEKVGLNVFYILSPLQ